MGGSLLLRGHHLPAGCRQRRLRGSPLLYVEKSCTGYYRPFFFARLLAGGYTLLCMLCGAGLGASVFAMLVLRTRTPARFQPESSTPSL